MVRADLTDRYITIYLPTVADKEKWEKAAKENAVPISKFVYEVINAYLSEEKDAPHAEIVRELSELREENRKLRGEVKLKNIVLEKYESEIYKLRHEAFAQIDMENESRRYDAELIEILKRGKPIDSYRLLRALGIDPRDYESVKLVNNQLEALSRFGLVRESDRGWEWII